MNGPNEIDDPNPNHMSQEMWDFFTKSCDKGDPVITWPPVVSNKKKLRPRSILADWEITQDSG